MDEAEKKWADGVIAEWIVVFPELEEEVEQLLAGNMTEIEIAHVILGTFGELLELGSSGDGNNP